jgi:hypothetical protein
MSSQHSHLSCAANNHEQDQGEYYKPLYRRSAPYPRSCAEQHEMLLTRGMTYNSPAAATGRYSSGLRNEEYYQQEISRLTNLVHTLNMEINTLREWINTLQARHPVESLPADSVPVITASPEPLQHLTSCRTSPTHIDVPTHSVAERDHNQGTYNTTYSRSDNVSVPNALKMSRPGMQVSRQPVYDPSLEDFTTGMDAYQWLLAFENTAKRNQWHTFEEKCTMFACYLKGEAAQWWERTKARAITWGSAQDLPTVMHTSVWSLFIEQFVHYRQFKCWYAELSSIKQEAGESPSQYTHRAASLLQRCRLFTHISDAEAIDYMLKGLVKKLRLEVARQIYRNHITQFDDVVRCIMDEAQIFIMAGCGDDIIVPETEAESTPTQLKSRSNQMSISSMEDDMHHRKDTC